MNENTTPVRVAYGGLKRVVAGPDYPPVRLGRRWPRLWPYARLAGVLLLVIICAATAEEFADSRELPVAVAWLLATLSVATVPVTFRWPLWGWRFSLFSLFLGTIGHRGEGMPWGPTPVLAAILALLVIAVRAEPPVLAWIGGLTLVPAWIFLDDSDIVGVVILLAVILIVGDTVRRLRRTRRALVEQTEVSELEQARRAVLEERARIARELHDVVAHHMSLIAVRAETAPYRLGDLPEHAREEFTAVATAAREALTDMRRLLGLLRSESAGPDLAPQPDLSAVTDLVDSARQAGMDVHYLPPEPDDAARPPDAVALAGFRIVQEALANATRHAPGAPVTVQLWPGARELAVRVHNSPSPNGDTAPDFDPDSGVGHGLAGMRERASLLGGEFSAGPAAGGGFVVTATLPYGDDVEP